MTFNTVCHVEFCATDIGRAQKFYERLFGWSFRPFSDDMVLFSLDGQHVGGISKVDEMPSGDSPSIWFSVKDVDASLTTAKELGGIVLRAKSMVPEVGWTASALDLDGNKIGLVQLVSE